MKIRIGSIIEAHILHENWATWRDVNFVLSFCNVNEITIFWETDTRDSAHKKMYNFSLAN